MKNYQSYNNYVSTGSVDNIIPVGQAFFVKASGQGLTFDNNIRVHNNKGFFKTVDNPANVLHLTAEGNSGSDSIANYYPFKI